MPVTVSFAYPVLRSPGDTNLDPRDPAPPVPPWRPTLRQRLGQVGLRASARLLGAHPILLDYPPPDRRHERWGWGAAPNRALAELLAGHSGAFRASIELVERHGPDLVRIPARPTGPGEPHWDQRWFTGLDAAALYSFIRERRPARYHEIGSGNSTLFAARAIRDGRLATRILSVDPEPRADVDRICDEVIRAPLQQAPLARVSAVAAGDVLLMDSSHYVLKNSDVVAFFFDVLVDLPAGVLVGIHDVFIPDDYPWWLSDRWYSEQYLLAARLLGAGDRARLVLASHYCATEPALRAELDAAWSRAGLSALAYGSTIFFET